MSENIIDKNVINENVEKVVGSPSLDDPEYWWFKVRSDFLESAFAPLMSENSEILDVGSSNSPSSQWMKKFGNYTPMDMDGRGLPSNGIVGSILDIPFEENTLDVVSAFDVIEHIGDDQKAIQEIFRVLKPGGRLILSVPAYEWVWSNNDVDNAHFRRYTKKRMARMLEREGFVIRKSTYGFCATFPLFAGNIIVNKAKGLENNHTKLMEDEVPPLAPVGDLSEKILMKLSKFDNKMLSKNISLPFGSSLFVCAEKP